MKKYSHVLYLLALFLLSPIAAKSQAVGQAVRAPRGMVASAEAHATEAGVAILKRGGNALDAAVATALALAVTYPTAGNLGGGGFMLVRMADGRAVAIDYREVAPELATPDMYLDKAGNLLPGGAREGHRAAGVPGTVAGLALALRTYGTMKWADVVEPARRLAAEGFVVSPALARGLKAEKSFAASPDSRRIFQRNGRFYEAGELFKQPELAATLERLQKKGPREFYEGRTAELIAEDMKAGGGLVTMADLKAYRPVVRQPVRGTYKGLEIITMPPPSSGGVVLIEMLNMLEATASNLPADQPSGLRLLAEVMRRAFADRAEFMGDPDFVMVPLAGLTSKRYARERIRDVGPNATPSSKIGHGSPAPYESPQTTHFSVVDGAGNAVSNTYTLNTGYGNGITVRGAGFLLNNEMDDFAAKPGSPNGFGLVQGEANAVAPRKRPLSSMTPTIVLKEGKLFLVVGSPGGPTIINTVLQVILNVEDGMDLERAVAAPRVHHQWLPDVLTYERGRVAPGTLRDLEAGGYHPEAAGYGGAIGDVQAILIDPASGARVGVSDPRSPEGKAAGH